MSGWVRRLAALSVGTVLAVAGCSSTGPVQSAQPTTPSPFGACPTTPSGAGVAAAAGGALPDVALPCFTGGAPVRLARLGVPAVISFWSSTCAPCRKELPELQRFADSTRGRVAVVGVITADRREAAASAGTDFGVTFPSVFDPDRTLLSALGRSALPMTVFLGADGSIRHTDVSGALSLSTVDTLAERYLGVAA